MALEPCDDHGVPFLDTRSDRIHSSNKRKRLHGCDVRDHAQPLQETRLCIICGWIAFSDKRFSTSCHASPVSALGVTVTKSRWDRRKSSGRREWRERLKAGGWEKWTRT
jgi:hypothetical protein